MLKLYCSNFKKNSQYNLEGNYFVLYIIGAVKSSKSLHFKMCSLMTHMWIGLLLI